MATNLILSYFLFELFYIQSTWNVFKQIINLRKRVFCLLENEFWGKELTFWFMLSNYAKPSSYKHSKQDTAKQKKKKKLF